MSRSEEKETRVGVNWTIVLTVTLSMLVMSLVGPLAWRVTAQATEGEAKMAGLWILVLITLGVLFGGQALLVRAFAAMALRFIQQDDADELRKSNQQFVQLAKVLSAVQRQQPDGNQSGDVLQALLAAGVGGLTGQTQFHDTTDVEMQ